jgi:hypothetical protein
MDVMVILPFTAILISGENQKMRKFELFAIFAIAHFQHYTTMVKMATIENF